MLAKKDMAKQLDERLKNPPPPWTFHINEDIGAFYYYNNETGVSQWEFPGNLEPASSAAPSSSHSSSKARKGLVEEDMFDSFIVDGQNGYTNVNTIGGAINTVGVGDGGSQVHPRNVSSKVVYKKGDIMMYVDGNLCEIKAIHYDDDPPYYTVQFGRGGRERQTQKEKLRPALSQEVTQWQSNIESAYNESFMATGIPIPASIVDSTSSLSPRVKPTPNFPQRREKNEQNRDLASAIKEKPAALSEIKQQVERLKNGWSTDDIRQRDEENGDSSKKKKYIIGPGGQNQDYLNLARIHKIQVPFYANNVQSRPLCVLCNKEGPLDVLFPCEHRSVCRTCIKKEGVVPIHDMNKVPNGHCNCPLCSSIIKLILPWEQGEEVEKYWKWIEEIKPELPQNFMRNWRHSAAIIQKCYVEDNQYNESVVVNTGACCTIT